ncbi:PREDICTED: uncharacterized protein LOC106812485 [Priapulus caudatus]|uniref:Uncharacterized protein LOC106812485 n=1 Tax=Priapulus caudatus TaxID=37621 RepID=A0ABM1EI38_PRICU|nr:PREDICTED: uncharacterized protein LOC106812485 [Priapulus caudatus]
MCRSLAMEFYSLVTWNASEVIALELESISITPSSYFNMTDHGFNPSALTDGKLDTCTIIPEPDSLSKSHSMDYIYMLRLATETAWGSIRIEIATRAIGCTPSTRASRVSKNMAVGTALGVEQQ